MLKKPAVGRSGFFLALALILPLTPSKQERPVCAAPFGATDAPPTHTDEASPVGEQGIAEWESDFIKR